MLRQQAAGKLQLLKTNNKELEESRKALMNVMEDLETAKDLIELEKAKDEAMFASIGEGLIAVDNNRRITVVNKAAENILGWKASELIGKEVTSLPLVNESGAFLPLKKRPTYAAISSGKSINANYFFVRKDKTIFPVAINVTPIKLGKKIIGAIDIFRDISHETEIDKAKSEFVSLASHQLRTPLGITKWYIEALEQENYFSKAPSIVKKYFEEIHKSNERVLSLVHDLLSVSRIEQGQVRNNPKPVYIVPLVSEIVDQMQIAARKKMIHLKLILKVKNIPYIDIDALRLHEVIENLISNAIDYTLTSGKIYVLVSQYGSDIQISVKDTGIGISVSDQKKLFTKFFRSEKAIKHNPEGSGLGLYVVKSYAEGWGGKISAESTEGKGSVFTISLPISQKGVYETGVN